jgi:soluble lytic murein transglycosylase-like protein
MTVPGYSQLSALRATAAGRQAAPRPGPARSMPQNAFAQALAQANAQNMAFREQIAASAATAQDGSTMPMLQQSGLPVEMQTLSGLFTQPSIMSAVPMAAATAAAPAAGALQVPGGFGPIIDQAAKKYGVDPALIAAVMETESKFNPDAVSGAGARGLMQLMPATARGLGVTDANDPVQNVLGGAKLLGQLSQKYNGNLELTLAAYNAGSGAVDKHGGIPPYGETRKYVPLVMSAYNRFRAQAGTAAPAATAMGR